MSAVDRALRALATAIVLMLSGTSALADEAAKQPPKRAESRGVPKKQDPTSKGTEPVRLADELPTVEELPVGPRQGSGKRNVAENKLKGAESEAKKHADTGQWAVGSAELDRALPPSRNDKVSARRPAHQVGPVPRKPSATLPPGVRPAASDVAARRDIAGGATRDEVRLGTDDPELRALREAERVLFPKPLDGAETGWSWDLPRPLRSEQNKVVASGLPPDARLKGDIQTDSSAADAEWLKSLALPNLPVKLDARVVKYLLFYRDNARGKAIARVWAKKSGRFVLALKAELARAGVPTDLVWLSLIESGHSPTIYSPVGAAGMWQFMPDAGRLYGLTVDRWVDERLDPQRSTEAAIRYLSDLHRRFGNWELAMAAYNMGHAGLSRAIRKFNTNDFWQLSRYEAGIPWETTLYVPKILATAIVMNNKKAFGISDVAPDDAVRFDTVRAEPGLSLQEVAQAAGVSGAAIEALNPHYLVARTPPPRPGLPVQSWPVRVPRGSGVLVSQRLAKTTLDELLTPYVVRFGDTAASIAARHKMTESRIKQINRIAKEEVLAAGTVVLVSQLAAGEPPGSAEDDRVVVVPAREFGYADRDRVFYRVLPGDTLGRIAQALGVTRAELLSWNALDTTARLQASMVLQAFVRKDTNLHEVRHLKASDTRVLVAGSTEFFDYFEGLNGRKRISIAVKDRDTLQSIGKRYGMSIGWMERINRKSRSDKLEPGESVIVYTAESARGSQVVDGLRVDPSPLGPINPPRPEVLPGAEALVGASTEPSPGSADVSPGG